MSTKNTLPLMCYARTEDGDVVQIMYGEKGYFVPNVGANLNGFNTDLLNEDIGVTKEQADIMKGASMFGWNIPLVTDYLAGA